MEIPYFKYHPNPIETGSIESTEEACECCEKQMGFRATSPIYAIDEIDTICPWCIANGSAATKFDGEFSDSYPLLSAGIDNDIIKEVCERTPSFVTWQQERWLLHCNDACEYHGDAEKSDLLNLSDDDLKEFLTEEGIKLDYWPQIINSYVKGGSLAIYKFKCRVCDKLRFYTDCD